jgi:hypothetical protein
MTTQLPQNLLNSLSTKVSTCDQGWNFGLEDLAQSLLEDGKPLPVPAEDAHSPDADLVELVPLSIHAGITYR